MEAPLHLAGSAAAAEKPRLVKRTKAGILVSSITLGDLEACFTMPTEKACVRLGVGLTILKRLCRKFGIARWPYRSLLKASKKPGSLPLARASPEPSSSAAPPSCGTPAATAGALFCQAPSGSDHSCGSQQSDSSACNAPPQIRPEPCRPAWAAPAEHAARHLPHSASQLSMLLSADAASHEQGRQRASSSGPGWGAPCAFRYSGSSSAFTVLPRSTSSSPLATAWPAPAPSSADAAALHALLSGGDPAATLAATDPGTRLRLAEQLLEVRGALRARLERRRAQLAAATAAGGRRCAPHAEAGGVSDAAALSSARNLLARYPL